jgi:excisionase family DNA binding protein
MPNDDFNPTEWITTTEAAELTRYWVTHIRRLVKEGRIKSKKFGRGWMMHRDRLLAYAEEMKSRPHLGSTDLVSYFVGNLLPNGRNPAR